MDVLMFVALVVPGFTACAEFGSYAFVHPVIKRLATRDHMLVEQGFLGTFGRVMPTLMTVSLILIIVFVAVRGAGSTAEWVVNGLAIALWAGGLVTTIVVNVRINAATGTWDQDEPPANWKEVRDRWEAFQGLRSWAYLLSFVAVCAGVSMG